MQLPKWAEKLAAGTFLTILLSGCATGVKQIKSADDIIQKELTKNKTPEVSERKSQVITSQFAPSVQPKVYHILHEDYLKDRLMETLGYVQSLPPYLQEQVIYAGPDIFNSDLTITEAKSVKEFVEGYRHQPKGGYRKPYKNPTEIYAILVLGRYHDKEDKEDFIKEDLNNYLFVLEKKGLQPENCVILSPNPKEDGKLFKAKVNGESTWDNVKKIKPPGKPDGNDVLVIAFKSHGGPDSYEVSDRSLKAKELTSILKPTDATVYFTVDTCESGMTADVASRYMRSKGINGVAIATTGPGAYFGLGFKYALEKDITLDELIKGELIAKYSGKPFGNYEIFSAVPKG